MFFEITVAPKNIMQTLIIATESVTKTLFFSTDLTPYLFFLDISSAQSLVTAVEIPLVANVLAKTYTEKTI